MVNKKMIMMFVLIAVIGLASAGCNDDNPVNPATIDEAPIAPPTKLTVELHRGKAKLEWGPSIDNRVVNYFVDREHDGDRINLGRTSNTEMQFLDESPFVGHSIYYVYAAGAGAPRSATVSVPLFNTLVHRTDNLQD